MLCEIAIADAYGAGFEFAKPEFIAMHNDLTQYQSHALFNTRGKYTDDTQMSMALAELLLHTQTPDEQQIAAAFFDTYKREPVTGYAKRVTRAFEQACSADEFAVKVASDSIGNGAAMRSVPVGVLPDMENIRLVAKRQAVVTHHSQQAIHDSQLVAIAAHLGGYSKASLSDLRGVLQELGYKINTYDGLPVPALSDKTISAVFYVLDRANCAVDILRLAVELGGDTDSVAAIALGIACCFNSFDKCLPETLVQQFAPMRYGICHLQDLDRRLKAVFPHT